MLKGALLFHFISPRVCLRTRTLTLPPKASLKECTRQFITLMNLVGFSRRGRPLVMQRQMPPATLQLLLMFKVMQRDRLIKRRLRDAPGPSFSRLEGLVTSGSRVSEPRDGGRRMETVPQEQPPHPHTHTAAYSAGKPSSPSFPLHSPCHHSWAGFTILQVFTARCLGPVLINPDIYSVAKSHRGEYDLKG